jgi:hypothetical protein
MAVAVALFSALALPLAETDFCAGKSGRRKSKMQNNVAILFISFGFIGQ